MVYQMLLTVALTLYFALTVKAAHNYGNATKEVFIGFYIESLGDLRASDMVQDDTSLQKDSAFDVDMYFRRSWKDESLSHNEDLKIYSMENMTDKMWMPDVYFANAKTAKHQDVTVKNVVMYVEEDGTLSFSSRIILNVACTLHLEKYPLDEQYCAIKMMSYGFPKNRLTLLWYPEEPISYNKEINLAEFDIQGIVPHVCDRDYNYAKTKDKSRTGTFSCLQAVIHLKRSIGYHLVQTYIPTGMIVIISWVSFWIDRTAVPARISLSFTTLLTLSAMGAGIRYSLPAVSYAKAIDYWMGMCMSFVFSALMEFAIVNSLIRRSQKYEKVAKETRTEFKSSHFINDEVALRESFKKPPKLDKLLINSMYRHARKYSRLALLCDKVCRGAFPAAFIMLNVFYWIKYLN